MLREQGQTLWDKDKYCGDGWGRGQITVTVQLSSANRLNNSKTAFTSHSNFSVASVNSAIVYLKSLKKCY